jgi:hypothetical protein
MGEPLDLNEVLSAAYLEQQKMTFHSDAEKGLGPVVSALSLGSPALMQFRPVPLSKKNREHDSKHKKRVVLTLELRHVRFFFFFLSMGVWLNKISFAGRCHRHGVLGRPEVLPVRFAIFLCQPY